MKNYKDCFQKLSERDIKEFTKEEINLLDEARKAICEEQREKTKAETGTVIGDCQPCPLNNAFPHCYNNIDQFEDLELTELNNLLCDYFNK